MYLLYYACLLQVIFPVLEPTLKHQELSLLTPKTNVSTSDYLLNLYDYSILLLEPLILTPRTTPSNYSFLFLKLSIQPLGTSRTIPPYS